MVAQDIEKLKQAFGDREFTGSDIQRVLDLKTFHGTGWRIKWLRSRNMIYATVGGYRFGTQPESTEVAPSEPPPAASEPTSTPPSLVRIGDLYLHERLLLIADKARQEASDAVRIYTTIIEVDPATKHPRNKIVNFIKARDPREYAQAIAWLDGMAGVPPHVVDDTALELAAELERKLNAANKEIADLKAKLTIIRGAAL